MTRRNPDRIPALVPVPVEAEDFDASMAEFAHRAAATPGLSAHVRRLRNRNQDISRWLVLAVFVGAVVALVMVRYAVR